MTNRQPEDLGNLLLRLSCGGPLLLHGIHKVFVELDHVVALVEASGMPGFLAYGNVVGEFVAPLLLIVGWWTRSASTVIVFNMAASILIAHTDGIFRLNDFGGWMIETNMLYLLAALSIVFLGPGRYSIDAQALSHRSTR